MTLTSTLAFAAWAVAGLLGTPVSAIAQPPKAPAATAPEEVEQIYIGRSFWESDAPKEFCSRKKIGFEPLVGATYTFRSTATDPATGRLVSANVQTIGRIDTCLGLTANTEIVTFYAEGVLAGVPFVGVGECQLIKTDFPERGLRPARCFLDLNGLPKPFVGGTLTTNTIAAPNPAAPESGPEGYTHTSIATIRLWKKR